MTNDNDFNDYREEEGQYRHAKRLERALVNRDPFYPNELHEQDVKDEQEEVLRCMECGIEVDESSEYFAEWGTCTSYCYGKLVGVYV